MPPWNNLFLIPLVLIGGLVAFFFGRTIIGSLVRAFGRATAHTPKAQVSINPQVEPDFQYLEKVLPRKRVELPSKQKTLAERREDWESEAIKVEDEESRLVELLGKLDEEEERRAKLREKARSKRTTSNAILEAYQDNRTSGPATTDLRSAYEALGKMLKDKGALDPN